MCKKCLRRSAIIMASLLSAVPVPPEDERDRHDNDEYVWDDATIAAIPKLAQAVVVFGDAEGDDPADDDPAIIKADKMISEVLDSFDTPKLYALGTLCQGLKRHFSALERMVDDDLKNRALKGDTKAAAILNGRMAGDVQSAVLKALRHLGGVEVTVVPFAPSGSPDGLKS